jgi:hypothetical protein
MKEIHPSQIAQACNPEPATLVSFGSPASLAQLASAVPFRSSSGTQFFSAREIPGRPSRARPRSGSLTRAPISHQGTRRPLKLRPKGPGTFSQPGPRRPFKLGPKGPGSFSQPGPRRPFKLGLKGPGSLPAWLKAPRVTRRPQGSVK